MNEIYDFFYNLLATNDWPPRWFCGKWSDFHGWLTIFSDLFIWLAYFFIPVILIKLIQSKSNLPFLPVFWLFGAFIILCGFTHLLDAIIFWWPAYRLGSLVKFATAVVSILTVFSLLRTLPKIINFDAPKDDKAEGLKEENQELKQKVDDLKRDLLTKENKIDKLNIEIIRLKNNI